MSAATPGQISAYICHKMSAFFGACLEEPSYAQHGEHTYGMLAHCAGCTPCLGFGGQLGTQVIYLLHMSMGARHASVKQPRTTGGTSTSAVRDLSSIR